MSTPDPSADSRVFGKLYGQEKDLFEVASRWVAAKSKDDHLAIILLKGSRSSRIDRVMYFLQSLYHSSHEK